MVSLLSVLILSFFVLKNNIFEQCDPPSLQCNYIKKVLKYVLGFIILIGNRLTSGFHRRFQRLGRVWRQERCRRLDVGTDGRRRLQRQKRNDAWRRSIDVIGKNKSYFWMFDLKIQHIYYFSFRLCSNNYVSMFSSLRSGNSILNLWNIIFQIKF